MAWTDDLVAYWKLEEAAGNRDDAHNSHDFTAYNAPGNAAGKQGNALDLEFDSDQYLGLASHADFQVGGDVAFALAGWAWAESFPASSYLLTKYHSGNLYREWFLYYDEPGDEVLKFYVRDAADTAWAIAAAADFGALAIETWYWIFCYHDADANEIGIEINDTSSDTAALAGGGRSDSARVCLGARDDKTSGQNWDGLFDEWCFWKGGFPSEAERTEMYNGGAGVTYPTAEQVPWSPHRWWIKRRKSGLFEPQLRLRPRPI